ncbi:uncharacterized protein TNCT_271921 [Trichonephila clavata]|uniref:Uncharacterized protein n=1 Tax=Trichonephila clavata TaxID=2740835 RepID=A0A8X6KJP0_TRICU|nr:uncharacterized protein TNCT_271921 [Trichonephila clavata]
MLLQVHLCKTARSRFRETSKHIKDEIFPVASLSDMTPIEFYVSGTRDNYIDLSHTLLQVQVKIKKKRGAAISAPDQVAPINYLLNTLFSECSVTLNDKQVSSQANYAYRFIFNALLSPRAVQESMLTAGLFYKDTASKHDLVVLTNVADNANSGYQTRYNICKDSKLMDLIGPLHFDLDRKKIKAAFSENEDDVEYMLRRKRPKKKANTSAAGFDLSLCQPSAANDAVKIQPYSIYLGRGIGVEIKEFRKNYYIAFSKTVDSEIRNCFNLALDQLPILAKVVEALQEYVKDQPTNSRL